MTTIETPVLIVGGGGLTATAVSKLGVAEAIYRRGTPAANMSHTAYFAGFAGIDPVYGQQIGRLECSGGGGIDTDWASASPCRQASLPQLRLEPILKRGAEALAPGRVRFHHELVDLEQDAGGVTARVLD
jgi:2,4-dichlorophenol 6-monooxygenase